MLDQSVDLVAVAIWTALDLRIVTLQAVTMVALVETTTSLAFHLSVGQEAARDSAGAPGFAISPSTHAGLALVPDKYRARFDGLTLLLR